MSDTIIKTQLGSMSVASSNGSANGGDKTPTTPTKLMINHGKPNFTIPRNLTKAPQNGDNETIANEKNNNYYPYKSAGIQTYSNSYNSNNIVVGTKFNGAFKPTNVSISAKQPHQTDSNENEASKVVLRRAKMPDTPLKLEEDEDDSVPEFIRRQRRIQERLAKENVLDFESRRSGYFTHVMISPTTPNRVSFGATMSSPPIVMALETPPPPPAAAAAAAAVTPPLSPRIEVTAEETQTETEMKEDTEKRHVEVELTNGNGAAGLQQHEITEEEEVAKAIEEVNKAVEGEDDEIKEDPNIEETPEAETEEEAAGATTLEAVSVKNESESNKEKALHEDNHDAKTVTVEAEVSDQRVEQKLDENQSKESTTPEPLPVSAPVSAPVEVHAPKENGHNDDITISHTNGFDGPNIPAPDPSGSLGVNYEPKTIVSFSKDLSNEPNRHPDTVKVVSQNDDANPRPVDEKLQELAKLKFQIIAGEEDVQVKPALRDE